MTTNRSRGDGATGSAGDAVRKANDAAALRDWLAEERDWAAERRDALAADREVDQDDRDRSGGRGATRMSYRSGARDDRGMAANDRRAAAADRVASAAERESSSELIVSLLHDDLTGLYRRGAGIKELEREVLMSHRTGAPFTVAFIDIDGLKGVNDTDGHEVGDRLIRRVADAATAVLREYDVAVRYGGDEFVCGMQGVEEGTAIERFADMQERLSRRGDGTATVGIAQLRPNETLQDVIVRADRAMYEAKAKRLTQA